MGALPRSLPVRDKRTDGTIEAVRKLQAQGHAIKVVVRQLGISRSTVDRYWVSG
ncbi:helix-turn-helix domain-containing protein [Pseudomonas sp. W22_MBD1_FP4]|uniref:helix-turn-helix domain-containing protein n=1 Tax=Pseudomonas sp. W22_MBD1_FP4 TaxID=3240272 RepID=UPI003F96B360